MSDFDDPFFGPPDAPPERAEDSPWNRIGVHPDGPGVQLIVEGDPVPWAPAAHNPKTGGRFIPSRQAEQAARIIRAWEDTGLGKIPKPLGVVVFCQFFVVRAKGHFGTGRNADVLRDDAPDYPTGRPDLSNMAKLAEDALTSRAWEDDDQVVRLEARKAFAARPGTLIHVWLAPGRLLDRELERAAGGPLLAA